VYFRPEVRVAQVASFERTAGSSTARPLRVSIRQHSSKSSGKPVDMPDPIDSRSFISVVSDTRQPSPTAPRRWASGIRASVK
jgi:hypothetical protein